MFQNKSGDEGSKEHFIQLVRFSSLYVNFRPDIESLSEGLGNCEDIRRGDLVVPLRDIGET